MITFSEDSPEWLAEWVNWAAKLLIPEWDLYISMDGEEPDNDLDSHGEVHSSPEYMRAHIKFWSKIKDTPDGHARVIHEICHAFLAPLSAAGENLISNNSVRRTSWKNFESAEEITVVRLSKSLLQLRLQLAGK